MAAPVKLREDFSADRLRDEARRSKDGPLTRRLLALAVIYDGGTRSDAAKLGGVGLQTIRDWVLRFNAEGVTGLIDKKAPGSAKKISDAQREELRKLIEDGPTPAIHGVVRWRLCDLCQWLSDEHGVSVDQSTMSRELKEMGFRKLSARPKHYAQNEHQMDQFKKTSRTSWQRSGRRSVATRNSKFGGKMKHA